MSTEILKMEILMKIRLEILIEMNRSAMLAAGFILAARLCLVAPSAQQPFMPHLH